MAEKVSEVMTDAPATVDANASFAQVAAMMRDQDIGDVIVTEEDSVCGMVTDRDIVVRGLAGDGDPSNMRIGDICSRDLVAVNADANIDEAVQLMRTHALRRLPVTRDGQLAGVVSIGDLAVTQDRQSALADISAAPPNN